jgi:hypothetical protein
MSWLTGYLSRRAGGARGTAAVEETAATAAATTEETWAEGVERAEGEEVQGEAGAGAVELRRRFMTDSAQLATTERIHVDDDGEGSCIEGITTHHRGKTASLIP